MNDIPTIAFIGLPLLTGCIGVGLGYWLGNAPSDEGYWKAIAEREEKRASANHRKFIGAAKEANRLEDTLAGTLGSNFRLTDALTAKNERLERIAAQETTGANATVKRMAAIARGEA